MGVSSRTRWCFRGFRSSIDASSFPFVIELLDAISRNKCDFDDGIESLDLLETFFVRRSLLGEFRTSLDCFEGLGEQIRETDNKEMILKAIPDEEWVTNKVLREFILSKKSSARL